MRWRFAPSIVVLTMVALVAACGDDDDSGSDDTSSSETTESTVDETTSTTLSPEQEVLRDYDLARNAIAAAANPPDPNHPELVRYWGGEALTALQAMFTQWQGLNVATQTEVQVDAEVTALAGDTATVRDCFTDTSQTIDLATGQPAGQPDTTTQHVDVNLERRDGVWVVMRQVQRSDPCPE